MFGIEVAVGKRDALRHYIENIIDSDRLDENIIWVFTESDIVDWSKLGSASFVWNLSYIDVHLLCFSALPGPQQVTEAPFAGSLLNEGYM